MSLDERNRQLGRGRERRGGFCGFLDTDNLAVGMRLLDVGGAAGEEAAVAAGNQ